MKAIIGYEYWDSTTMSWVPHTKVLDTMDMTVVGYVEMIVDKYRKVRITTIYVEEVIMSKALTRLILNSTEYNGHSDFTIKGSLSLEVAKDLCAELEEILEDELEFSGFVAACYFSDGSGHIEAIDFWKDGEHPLGHKNKTLISWEG